jgi:hypothetical protein
MEGTGRGIEVEGQLLTKKKKRVTFEQNLKVRREPYRYKQCGRTFLAKPKVRGMTYVTTEELQDSVASEERAGSHNSGNEIRVVAYHLTM